MVISDAMSHAMTWWIHGKSTESTIHAVSMARGEGLGIAETACRQSISSKTIANWVKQAQEGQDFTKHNAVSDADAENCPFSYQQLQAFCGKISSHQ